MEIHLPPIDEPNWCLSYIKDYPQNEKGEFKAMPSTFAMYWAMSACNMNRLFFKEDMKEFLFRLAITLEKMKLMENWFSYDKVLNFSLKGMQYSLSAKDILFHFGFQSGDGLDSGWRREKYLDNLGKGVFNAKFIGALMDCQIIPLKRTGEDQYSMVDEAFDPEITDKLISNASFFSEDVLKLGSDDLFTRTCDKKEQKLEELVARRKRAASIPEFTLEIIPDGIIEECMDSIFLPEYLDELMKPENKEKWNFECFRMIKLAWLWANDLFIFDEGEVWEVEGVSLRREDYEDEDGGSHLYRIIEDYELKELTELLKGIGFKESQT